MERWLRLWIGMILDTTVLSVFLRRAPGGDWRSIQLRVRESIATGEGVLLGPVRQELLTGFRDPVRFTVARENLRAIPDTPCVTTDYERAAEFANLCRTHGIAGSPVDFLLCAVAERLALPIFTLDRDFERYSGVLPITAQVPSG